MPRAKITLHHQRAYMPMDTEEQTKAFIVGEIMQDMLNGILPLKITLEDYESNRNEVEGRIDNSTII